MAQAGETLVYTQSPADGAVRRLNENPGRCKWLIVNRNVTGNAFWSRTSRINPNDAQPTGNKIYPNGGSLLDDVPGVHKGEVYVAVDTANLVYEITEWSEEP